MALIQVNLFAETLMRTVPVNVILPVERKPVAGVSRQRAERPFKTLYLLHGVTGNYMDWLTRTNIQEWAVEKDLAVVMPSGDNMFYVDQPGANNFYGEYIGQELVELTRKMFPLSHKREGTFIAGLSMGGYGAIRNGLKYHDTFGYIGGLSSALITYGLETRTNESSVYLERRDFAESIFGDLSKVKDSDMNPEWLVKKLSGEKVKTPKMYLACGTEDFLLDVNRKFRDVVNAAGMDAIYEEGPGGHEWAFWNSHIKKIIDWLPLQ